MLLVGLHLFLRLEPTPGLAVLAATATLAAWLAGIGVVAAAQVVAGRRRTFGSALGEVLRLRGLTRSLAVWPLVGLLLVLGLLVLYGLASLPLVTRAPTLVAALGLAVALWLVASVALVLLVTAALHYVRVVELARSKRPRSLRDDLLLWRDPRRRADQASEFLKVALWTALGLAAASGSILLALRLAHEAAPDRAVRLLGPSPLGLLLNIPPPPEPPLGDQAAAMIVTLAAAAILGAALAPALGLWARTAASRAE